MTYKKILIPMAVVAVLSAGAYGVSQASAASSSATGQTLAQKIASAFNLDPSKVQDVVNQYRDDHSAQREANYESRLTQAVTDGKLTATQKDAVLAEHSKLDTELQAAMGQTGSARRTAMKAVRTEAQTWATANNIDSKWLLGPARIRGGHRPASTPSPSPSASSVQ